MKVVLHSVENTGEEGHPPLPIAYLCSYIRKYAPEIEIKAIDHAKEPIREILKLNPDVVGISSMSLPFYKAREIAQKIKKINPKTLVVLGGHHISNLPQTLPEEFDIGVIGEGEETFKEILQNFLQDGNIKNLKKIKGICFHHNGQIKINPPRPLIENLDDIPIPARDVFDMEGYYLQPRRSGTMQTISRGTHMITSKGCPFNCVFCASPRKRIRFFSAERVVEEMNLLYTKYNVQEIAIVDDLFVVDINRLKKILELMKTKPFYKKVSFFCETRTDIFNEEMAIILKEMNVKTMAFGFESGSEEELKYLKRNTTTVKDNNRACKICKKYGFAIDGYFIIGSPIQTREDLAKTIKFIKDNKINYISIATATPFPGSDWWEYAKKLGLVDDFMDFKEFDTQARNSYFFINQNFSKEEYERIIRYMKKFEENFNFNISIAFKDLFSLFLIKRAIKNPKRAWTYIKHSLFKKK
jgi:radical SAM superfamily enzyme YgiQ (UPF0313 family)